MVICGPVEEKEMEDLVEQQVELTEVTGSEQVDEICRFRAAVWLASQGANPVAFPSGSWRDPIDDGARHWVARDSNGNLLAAARFAIHDQLEDMIEHREYRRYYLEAHGPIAAPDRVVVAPAAQGQGLASQLLAIQHKAATAAGAVCALRQASPRMVRLLRHRGWRMHGPASIDPRFPGVTFTVASFIFDSDRAGFQMLSTAKKAR
jgi:GNAT superfamily N-acetyltransferase